MWKVTVSLAVALTLTAAAAAQPPGRRGGPPDRFGGPGGPGGGLERVLDDLNLPEAKREAAGAAVRVYQMDARRLTDLARADLLWKMKPLLNDEEFKKVREAVDRFRDGPGGVAGRGATADEVVERIMSFDANKDGKVTKDELPERMQDLIARGDTNKDGALDRDEIKKLAADLARDGGLRGGGRGPRGRGGVAGGLPPGAIERAVDELKLPEGKKESAAAAVRAHREDLRKLTELARADLLLQMGGILSAEEFTKFKEALDRQPGLGERRGGPPPGRFGPGRP